MKNLILIFLLFINSVTFSQEKIQLLAGFSGSFEKEVISNRNSQVYGGLRLTPGIRFNFMYSSLDLSLNYKFSSNVISYISNSHSNEEHRYIVYNSVLRSHFSGLSLKYTFKNKDRIIKPLILLSG